MMTKFDSINKTLLIVSFAQIRRIVKILQIKKRATLKTKPYVITYNIVCNVYIGHLDLSLCKKYNMQEIITSKVCY